MIYKEGQIVRCSGEGDRIYKISQLSITRGIAYLTTVVPGKIDAGWKSFDQLSPVEGLDPDRVVEDHIVKAFATCTVPFGEYHANDYIVPFAQEILRLRAEVEALRVSVDNLEQERYEMLAGPWEIPE